MKKHKRQLYAQDRVLVLSGRFQGRLAIVQAVHREEQAVWIRCDRTKDEWPNVVRLPAASLGLILEERK